MIIIITCFGIIILGFVNLYYIINNNDVSENQERIETQKNFETFSNNINDNINLSEDELFIKNNYNLIQQLKEEYSDKDTEIIKNYSVELCFFEKAGLLYYDLEKNGNVIILGGEYVSHAKVIILDYFSDEIIYTYDSTQNTIQHYQDSQNKFYCIIINDDYDIYVTHPIQIIGGDDYNRVNIFLNKKNSTYTSLCQIYLNMQNFEIDNSSSDMPNDYFITFGCRNKYSRNYNKSYGIQISESGVLSYNNYSYFSINTNYILDIYLYNSLDDKREFPLAHQIFDGLVTNSNLVDVTFEFTEKNNM